MNKIIAYTDGSSNWKNGLGGYGVYMKVFYNDHLEQELYFHEGFSNTKTGRMELRAIITCLQKINDKSVQITIYSDSQYAIKCVTERRLWRWERSLWDGIKNVDLLKQYLHEVRQFRTIPKLIHIKGHQENIDNDHIYGNNMADLLADYKQFKEYKEDIRL